jgi:transposase-like protein
MALSQSVLSALLDASRADEGVDLVRGAVHMVMQEVIEAEATEQIGAARYERLNTRVTERNGSRPRLVATQAGDIELHMEKRSFGFVLRARVVGIFPNEASLIRFVDAVLADTNDEWQAGDRRYLSAGSMSTLYPDRDTGAVAALNTGD